MSVETSAWALVITQNGFYGNVMFFSTSGDYKQLFDLALMVIGRDSALSYAKDDNCIVEESGYMRQMHRMRFIKERERLIEGGNYVDEIFGIGLFVSRMNIITPRNEAIIASGD